MILILVICVIWILVQFLVQINKILFKRKEKTAAPLIGIAVFEFKENYSVETI